MNRGTKIPLQQKSPRETSKQVISSYCFQIFRSQGIVQEPSTEMPPPSPIGEGWDFYLHISSLTTHHAGRKRLEEHEDGRTQLAIQFPMLMHPLDTTGLKDL